MKKKTIIAVKDLTMTYEYVEKQPGLKHALKNLFASKKKKKEAVKKVSFEIAEGELVGFLGPNGAGKTTTLKMLSGVLTPTGGRVRVLGYEPIKRENAYKMQFAFVMGQKSQLWWDLPPMESFLLSKKMYEVSDEDFDERIAEMIDVLGVKEVVNKQVRQLSLGERMKCELIAALIHHPRVLFLDEPTIGLDVVAQKNIRDFIRKYNTQNKTTIILTSHYMEDIAELCKRIIIIDGGKIIYDGSIENMIKQYAPYKKITVDFDREVSEKDVAQFAHAKQMGPFSASIEAPRDQVSGYLEKLLRANLPIVDLSIGEEDIESIIRNIFTK